jgi:hypothetical protein
MEAAILFRLLDVRGPNLSPAAAEFLLTIQFPADDVVRMNRLSELAQEGTLTAEQQGELDSYIHVSNLLAVMQSRARKLLKSRAWLSAF